jgi:hypothetical protein
MATGLDLLWFGLWWCLHPTLCSAVVNSMNPEIILSTVSILFAAGLATKLLAQRASSNNHLILVLALFSGTGVLLAMGSIEMAGRYGYTYLYFFAIDILANS